MRVYSGSDIGLMRDSNQDYCMTGEFSDHAVWAVVCDGMGGANGGCTASSVATETIAGILTEQYQDNLPPEDLRELMEDAVGQANLRVFDMSLKDPSLYGMGTTVVCAVAENGRYHFVHAGDSRAYLWHEGRMTRVTTDHSVVQELVTAGKITEDEARVHPNRNIITRALGVEPVLVTDYNTGALEEGDRLMICTDGLSGYFSDEELCGMMGEKDGDALVTALIEAAKQAGGSDNITVAVIAD